MFLHPHISSKTIISDVEDKDVQSNAVDLRLERVFKLNTLGQFFFSEEERKNCPRDEVFTNYDGLFDLGIGAYEIKFLNTIEVGEDEAGWVITRSSLLRNGSAIHSGLYDSGYKGTMSALLVCHIPLKIQKLTRVGQYLCVKAETKFLYNGSYGFGSELTQHLN